MDETAESIIATAMNMPVKERAFIAERLIASLDQTLEENSEIEWQNEIQKRIADINAGDVKCVPWEVVRKRLRINSNVHD